MNGRSLATMAVVVDIRVVATRAIRAVVTFMALVGSGFVDCLSEIHALLVRVTSL